MAIRTVVTLGFGNGTFNGSVNLLPTLGYAIGEAVVRPDYICWTTESLTTATFASESLTAASFATESLTTATFANETLECL